MKNIWSVTAALILFLTGANAQIAHITPAKTIRTLNSLKTVVASGTAVTLVDAENNVVATVDASGAVTITEGADLSTAQNVVLTPAGGAPSRYTLATPVNEKGLLFVTYTSAGQNHTLPLIAALNRDAAHVRAAQAHEKQQEVHQKGAEKYEEPQTKNREFDEKVEIGDPRNSAKEHNVSHTASDAISLFGHGQDDQSAGKSHERGNGLKSDDEHADNSHNRGNSGHDHGSAVK